MPPLPKPPQQRVRRNIDQPKWRQLPAEGRKGVAPTLPVKKPGWLKATREWWKTIWASPMATAWMPADAAGGLLNLARLVDMVNRGTAPVAAFGQIATLEDRYGLSPKARRQLQWEVARAAEPAEPIKIDEARARRLRAV